MSNLLQAVINISKNTKLEAKEFYKSRNRANNMGEALEKFVEDAFCNSFMEANENKRNVQYSKVFSYLGNQNNPPDMILKNGDAIEVKKVESFTSGLALNSSYPKDKLYSDSPMITKQCKECEKWAEKDIIYAVGVVNTSHITHLCFVYGEDYAASHEVYERIKTKIKYGVSQIPEVEFADTKELGRVNRVDPLGITYLRIRGMWGIENPFKVFDYVYKRKNDGTDFFALINTNKYNSFPDNDRKALEELDNVVIEDCKIKDTNNPAKLKSAKLIRIIRNK